MPLSGCISPLAGGAGGGVSFASRSGDDAFDAPARKVRARADIVRGAVVVQGPKGYCIDAKSLTSGGISGGFALLASCESLLGRPAEWPVLPAVMTVTVLPYSLIPVQPRAHEMAAALAPHRALDQINGDGLTIVHLATGGEGLSPKVDPKHWRGAMVINGHMIGLAVYAPKGSDLSGKDGLDLLGKLAETLREASPVKSAAAVQRAKPPLPAAAAPTPVAAQPKPETTASGVRRPPQYPAAMQTTRPAAAQSGTADTQPRAKRIKKLFPRLFQ
ncbi:hypothetical protein [Litorivita sp. NS0012-18]|uniref:hypothetical protein n=1 Tax=Litorivita sp. NS0012-18 TaxID=3127655 RepID=UPI00310289A6